MYLIVKQAHSLFICGQKHATKLIVYRQKNIEQRGHVFKESDITGQETKDDK